MFGPPHSALSVSQDRAISAVTPCFKDHRVAKQLGRTATTVQGVLPCLCAALVILICSAAVQAQETSAAVKEVRIAQATSAITVDGSPDEAAWDAALPITDFVQQEPSVNEPVSERTEVRVLFDLEALYFAIRFDDSEPGGVTAREFRRDNNLVDDDRFEVVIDTFHDHRNAFYFVVNPLATQFDAIVTDEGQDVNAEWDERWWSEANITDDGWTAEIRIPFTTLRSQAGIDTFGINFKRFIRRKNETAQWMGWDRAFSFMQVSQAGHLTGVEGIETGLKLRIKPYVLGGMNQNRAALGPTFTDRTGDIGLEIAKFSLTSGLTAEITANTDFAQAEVDEAVVNLTRFPIFFPEKREFFLERAGIFEFGLGVRRGGGTERQIQMFFPRRIGLTDERTPVPVRWGAKIIGRAAGFDMGLLNAETAAFEGLTGSTYSVARVKRNVLSRSYVGGFFSNRQSAGADYNRVAGADVNFTVLKNTDFQASAAKSFTPDKDGNDAFARFKYNWLSDLFEVYVDHLYVGPDFQNDSGFVRRSNVQRTDHVFVWEPRPDVLNLRTLILRGEVIYTTDIDRRLLNRDQIFQFVARFQNDDTVSFNTTNYFDRLDGDFQITRDVTISPGDYQYRDTWVQFASSPQRLLFGSIRTGRGDFYNGTRKYLRISPSFKPLRQFSLETTYELNEIDLPQGAFTTHVVNMRFNVNLSNTWLTSTVSQYDSETKRQILFFRLNYIFRPGDDFFIVFNQSRQLVSGSGHDVDRTLLVKWTYSFDF